jgi:hypothetical protein
MHSISNADAGREAWQAEIRKIWEYLLIMVMPEQQARN